MAQHTTSILSTHSGHHRIFIGPVVQRQTNATNNNYNNASSSSSSSSNLKKTTRHSTSSGTSHSHSRGHGLSNNAGSSLGPKPWWEQGSSFLRSHLSLHNPSPPSTSQPTLPGAKGGSTGVTPPSSQSTAGTSSQRPGPIPQTKIPQFSYTFSDDSSTDSEDFYAQESDEDAYDSEEEQIDYEQDQDTEEDDDEHYIDTDHDDDDVDDLAPGHSRRDNHHPFQTSKATSSSESVSAPVGQGGAEGGAGSGLNQSQPQQQTLLDPASRSRDKGKGKAVERTREEKHRPSLEEDCVPQTSGVTRGPSKAKKKTKSMRDEGEPSRFKKFLGNYRERRHNQGMLDGSDLGWESDGSRQSRSRLERQATSGALTLGHQHDHGEHHPVLVSSPMTSELDLPGTNPGVGPPRAFSEERPDPRPIQNAPPNQDHLSPGSWNSPSSTSLSSATSPMRSDIQRGATWVTAREYASSLGQSSIHDAIPEEDEPEDSEDDHDHYHLAKAISRETDHAGVGTGDTIMATGRSRTDSVVEDLGIADDPPKEPFSTTLTKAGTRIGRAILKRAPTGLKHQDGEPPKAKPVTPTTATTPQPTESICTVDKDCRPSEADPANHKHVRFLTKVQYQISSSRQPTMLSTHPVIRQDRMLVRKEMTERPGPHVYNSDTARRLERQSEGWKEWWCVMKGPPQGPKPPVTKIKKKSKGKPRVEKGRLEFYYNHKKIKGTVILSSVTTVSVYSSLDYSIAVTQNYKEEVGLTVYILRPRTYSLACAWYMEIYTLLNGAAPIPKFIEIAVPDFDVKIRVPIPEDSDSETESDSDDGHMDTGLAALPQLEPGDLQPPEEETPYQSFQTAATTLPERMASKSFYLTNDDAKPTLVAPDEVTPKLLRSHALSLLADVPDWTDVVKRWQDPGEYGDVALCWKRYDRIEWIYWDERVASETDNVHLKKDHIGFADGSSWSGHMDTTVVGPQVLDKTHVLELRPITHYPTKAREPSGETLYEPDPIEGYLVRVSTFSGNPIRRFRRLYLTSHDHLLIYTIPSQAHSPTMQHAGSIDPTALMFCISPHRSANPDHKDMAQSRSVRRLKSQVRSARGFIDMTQIDAVRVMSEKDWNVARYMGYIKEKRRDKESKFVKLKKRAVEAAEEAKARHRVAVAASSISQPASEQQGQPPPQVILREPDNYFFPTEITEPLPTITAEPSGSTSGHEDESNNNNNNSKQPDLDSSEPLYNSLSRNNIDNNNTNNVPAGTFKDTIVKSATFVADLFLHNDQGQEDEGHKDSNVIEIEMKDGTCVRFRCFNPEAAHLWRDQLEKLARYWRLRKHLDVRDHMQIAQANYQLASSLDDDEIQVGETIQDWDNDRAAVSPEIWNWCVVNGCRSVTKAGVLYYKPKLHKTFRKMVLVLTEGVLMLFHPHRRSKVSGHLIPTTTCKLFGIHSLMDIYVYSGHFSDEDTSHGTNDESERLPRFYPDGLIVDDPDEDCTFSIWRGKRQKMFSRRGVAMTAMASRSLENSSSRLFGKSGWLKGIGKGLVKDGVVYGSTPQSCGVFRARSRPELEEWVFALNTEIERCVRLERKRIKAKGHA
ncbi:hypothetical protein BGZ83_006122 [Gryganskiella cystojenkinii]|nr:hypothetical protein BGZ83_006122 [Gryganskiella cystojenkinii]